MTSQASSFAHALYLKEKGKLDEARQTLKRLEPTDSVTALLCLIDLKQNKTSEAIPSLKKFLEQNPEALESALCLLICLCDLGYYKEAQFLHNKILSSYNFREGRKEDLLVRTYTQCASIYEAHKEPHLALELLKEALKHAPDLLSLRHKEIKSLLNLGHFSQVEAALEEILQKDPDDLSALLTQGIIFYLKNDIKNAEWVWKKAQNLFPSDPATRFFAGLLRWTTSTPSKNLG